MEKIQESMASVLPITAIVLLLSITLAPLDSAVLVLFLFGAVLLVGGMGLFTMGVDMSMIPMGEVVGVTMSRSKFFLLPVVGYFLLGVLSTVAEPDLQVLAEQVPAIDNLVLILTVAVGVGFFLVVAALRIRLAIPLRRLLLVFYCVVFLLAALAPGDFIPVSFDSGGVTTGPITVPFIMALGLGIASTRSDANSASDSFGLISLCSIGPILAVLLLGICYRPESAGYSMTQLPELATTADAARCFRDAFPGYFKEVAAALAPIAGVFVLFQAVTRHFQSNQLLRIGAGLLYTYLGLVLFLCGVNVGFGPVGTVLGRSLAQPGYKWLLVPIGMLIGFFIVKAEPAIQVLNRQIQSVTSGAISARAMNRCLSIGVSVSVGLAMLRVVTGIPVAYILLPGYVLALGLSFVVPPIFVGIAFDSGGVASGPMTTTFLLPLSIGACETLGGNVMTDAFGVVALVALTPLIAVQLMGVAYRIKMSRVEKRVVPAFDGRDEIVELEEEWA